VQNVVQMGKTPVSFELPASSRYGVISYDNGARFILTAAPPGRWHMSGLQGTVSNRLSCLYNPKSFCFIVVNSSSVSAT